jgi:hypothetical protein
MWSLVDAMAQGGGDDVGQGVVEDWWFDWRAFRKLGREFFPARAFPGKHQTTSVRSQNIENNIPQNQLPPYTLLPTCKYACRFCSKVMLKV